MTKDEAQRIATAINLIRPDWATASIVTVIGKDHALRPAKDVGVALMWLALDPTTETPGRLNETGPWWNSARASYTTTTTPTPRDLRTGDECDVAGHEGYFRSHCAGCRADRLAAGVA